MTEKNISKNLECVKKMPPLMHRIEGEPFDITKSEVAQWLIQQPGVMQWIFDHVNNIVRNRNGEELLIKYNPDTGKWQGVDYAT
jgi:hypothetical protein